MIGTKPAMRTLETARFIVPLLVIAAVSQAARAEDFDACSVAYARGQEERVSGRLFNARAAFQECATAACPTALASDCGRWVKEVEADLPTIRLTAHDPHGAPVENLKVSIDGAIIPIGALSAPIVLEAGPHEVRMEAPGYQPVRLDEALRPSDREVPVVVTLRPPPAVVPETQARPVPTAAWVMAGVGAVALGTSIYFGARANSQYHDLKQSCAPTCDPSASDGMYANAVSSDVALASGVVAFAASAIIYFTRPSKHSAAALELEPAVAGGRARVLLAF